MIWPNANTRKYVYIEVFHATELMPLIRHDFKLVQNVKALYRKIYREIEYEVFTPIKIHILKKYIELHRALSHVYCVDLN